MAGVGLRLAHHPDDVRAAPGCDLRRRLSDFSVEPKDQHSLSGTRHPGTPQPFKRGDDLSEREARALREAMVGQLGRVIEAYEAAVRLPLPEKYPKPTRVHPHQGEPCPRCDTVLEAVFYEDYVMTYCPHCETDGRILKGRRLSRLLK